MSSFWSNAFKTSPGSLHALAVQRRFQSRVCTFIKCAERGCRAALFTELCRPVYGRFGSPLLTPDLIYMTLAGVDVLSAVLEVILSLSRSQEQCAVDHIGVSPVMVPEPQWSSLTTILIKSVDILMESDLVTPLHRLWFSREEAEGVLARLLCECPLLPVTAREAVLCVALGCWVPEPYIHHSSCGVPVLPSVKHRRGVCLDDAVPLSSSYLWRSQTAFYESEGNRAWDTGLVRACVMSRPRKHFTTATYRHSSSHEMRVAWTSSLRVSLHHHSSYLVFPVLCVGPV